MYRLILYQPGPQEVDKMDSEEDSEEGFCSAREHSLFSLSQQSRKHCPSQVSSGAFFCLFLNVPGLLQKSMPVTHTEPKRSDKEAEPPAPYTGSSSWIATNWRPIFATFLGNKACLLGTLGRGVVVWRSNASHLLMDVNAWFPVVALSEKALEPLGGGALWRKQSLFWGFIVWPPFLLFLCFLCLDNM